MQKIVEKNKCTGCTACKNICPQNAISMKEGYDGFLYPEINQSKCIDCGLCKKTCPVINTKTNKSINNCYAGYANDEKIILNSSSGGLFTIIADYIIKNNGFVIGAAFDEQNKLNHIAISKNEELEELRGSKYLQSNLNDIFGFIKNTLKTNKVLFVGTPCQVAGLKSYIKNDYNNLICIDIICHGTPSPKLFDKYIKELENENGQLLNYNFRDKSTGWESYSNTASFKEKKITDFHKNNDYMKLFLSNIALRESCYNCNFKLENKYSDITLGDFWGVKKEHPNIYNEHGVSAIIINTNSGLEIFNRIKADIKFEECKLEDILQYNQSLSKSSQMPKNREQFFNEIDSNSIKNLSKKYVPKKSLLKTFKNYTIIIIKKVLKKNSI